MFKVVPVVNANSVDPNQTPAASDLGLHCLHMSLLWDAKLKRANNPLPLTIQLLYHAT